MDGGDSDLRGREEVQDFNPRPPNAVAVELQEVCLRQRGRVGGYRQEVRRTGGGTRGGGGHKRKAIVGGRSGEEGQREGSESVQQEEGREGVREGEAGRGQRDLKGGYGGEGKR